MHIYIIIYICRERERSQTNGQHLTIMTIMTIIIIITRLVVVNVIFPSNQINMNFGEKLFWRETMLQQGSAPEV